MIITDMKRLYEATYVTVKKPDGTYLFKDQGPLNIVLDIGDYVWVHATYSDEDQAPEIKRVLDPNQVKSYGQQGECILSVPASWCMFYMDEEAEQIAHIMEIDSDTLQNAY